MTADPTAPRSRRRFLAAAGTVAGGLALGGTVLARQGDGRPSSARHYRVTVANRVKTALPVRPARRGS